MPSLDFLAEAPQRLEFSTTLDCTPERAFAILADATSWPLWFDGCKACVWDTPSPHQVGSVRTITMQLATAVEEIIAFEPGERFAFWIRKLSPPLVARMIEDIRLTGDHGTTRVDWTVAYEPSLLGIVVQPIAKMIFSRMFRRSLVGLKRFTRPAAE